MNASYLSHIFTIHDKINVLLSHILQHEKIDVSFDQGFCLRIYILSLNVNTL